LTEGGRTVFSCSTSVWIPLSSPWISCTQHISSEMGITPFLKKCRILATHILARLDLCLNVGAPALNLLKQSSTNDEITDFQIKLYQGGHYIGTLIDLHLVGRLAPVSASGSSPATPPATRSAPTNNQTRQKLPYRQNSALGLENHLDARIHLLEPRQSLQIKEPNRKHTSRN
jgi:hypothetical protein